MLEYRYTSEASSPHTDETSVHNVGEFIDLITQAIHSDSDSITSPTTHRDSSSTSSDSSLSDPLHGSGEKKDATTSETAPQNLMIEKMLIHLHRRRK